VAERLTRSGRATDASLVRRQSSSRHVAQPKKPVSEDPVSQDLAGLVLLGFSLIISDESDREAVVPFAANCLDHRGAHA
jgi:hypothetical protein